MIQYLVLLGGVVNLYGLRVYIREILHKQTSPNLITWVLWAATAFIATGAAYANGVRWAAFPSFMIGVGSVIVIIAALINHKAIWKPTIFDYICGGLSLAALVLWIISKEANVAIVFAILSDGLAALPTLKKAWLFPETESGIAYITAIFNMLTTIAALRIFNFSELAFPLYSVSINVAISLAIYRKKLSNKNGEVQDEI